MTYENTISYISNLQGDFMKINNRLNGIGEYHFKNLDYIREKRISMGKKVVDLSIGDPNLLVDENIKEGLIEGMNKKGFNKYPPYDGLEQLKLQIIKYYKDKFSVQLEEEEIVILIGSKEGISNVIPSVCDVGDTVLVPEPGYPVYYIASKLWGCFPCTVPLKEENNYLIDLDNIPENTVTKAKLMFINYPNNPTGANATEEFFERVVKFAKKNNIIVCNDAAYCEIIEQDIKPISILQFDKEKTVVEFGSFSKLYNMTGFRVGYAVGNKEVIKNLIKVKSNLDSGQFMPIQYAAINALKLGDEYNKQLKEEYSKRRVLVKKILKEKNIKFFDSYSTFYIWCKTPKGYTTYEFCLELLNKYGIIVTPGDIFGTLGYDYFRIALTQPYNIIENSLSSLDKYE